MKMKIVTYQASTSTRIGMLDESEQYVSTFLDDRGLPLRDLLDLMPYQDNLLDLPLEKNRLPLDQVRIAAPIPYPRRNLFCVGKNYVSHASEFSRSGFDSSSAEDVPSVPIVFSKAPSTVIGHGDPIWDASGITEALDYEAELAVIIGRAGRTISRESAMDHVWGYTIINDVTARDWQKRHQQWFLGKSFDTFGPMGPCAVPASCIDGSALMLRCWVNGELRQAASTRDLIFDIPTLIETISAGITLEPGDIIATGTPAGVGIGYQPPRFLKQGDVVTIEVEGIGRLENRIGHQQPR
jgi:2-keto-4-pentenoate hydratase/2-oxohepta-3-ene-1,7-dioic acid hydratase in catechol pathway